VVTVPGSKSIANRALVCAALADGTSALRGLPPGDDSQALVRCLAALGVEVTIEGDTATVGGTGGRLRSGPISLDAKLAGTTSRFVTAVAALADGPVTVDGAPALRRRPMGPLHDALSRLGAVVESDGGLPVTVRGPLRAGGTVEVPGDVSSQFLTALMLIGPMLDGGVRLIPTTPLVSAPYLSITAEVMAAFGVAGVVVGEEHIDVPAGRYVASTLDIEPDASSASYPLAMAAVAGGRVEVTGLHRHSLQGDAAFVDLLAGMGCTVGDGRTGVSLERDSQVPLHGIDVDMSGTSDLVPTLAVVAATASTPTIIRGVGFIRRKESDRLGDLAVELGKTGSRVSVDADGLRIEPGALHGADLASHDDHRLAMAFGVLATVVEGISVDDPGVVSKSWPGYWAVRESIIGS
jgi:3-phosphoshikimate 1-carboxyvinyltransferase